MSVDAAARRPYLNARRRSVRTHASNQFNKGRFPGRTGIEQEWRSIVRLGENDRGRGRKIDIGKVGVIAGPALGNLRHHRAQNFAALNVRRIVFLLCGLGVKRAFVFDRLGFGRDGADRAMIGNRDPGTDRNRDGHASHACLHGCFNRRRAMIAQIFSFGSISGGMISGSETTAALRAFMRSTLC
jgi:hypothetical protein